MSIEYTMRNLFAMFETAVFSLSPQIEMVENKNFCDVISALQTSFLCAGCQLVQLHHYPHASCSLTGQHVNKEDYFHYLSGVTRHSWSRSVSFLFV